MTEPPPPGWYPTSETTQRYWDGELWSEHSAPRGQSAVPTPAPTKKFHALTWVLITLALLFVLGVGGCIAVVSSMGNNLQQYQP